MVAAVGSGEHCKIRDCMSVLRRQACCSRGLEWAGVRTSVKAIGASIHEWEPCIHGKELAANIHGGKHTR